MNKYIVFAVFILALTSNAISQTDRQWIDLGKGILAMDCGDRRYSEYKFIKIARNNREELPAVDFLTWHFRNNSDYRDEYVMKKDYYVSLLHNKKLYKTDINSNIRVGMDEKTFIQEIPKFIYLYYVTQFTYEKLNEGALEDAKQSFPSLVQRVKNITTEYDNSSGQSIPQHNCYWRWMSSIRVEMRDWEKMVAKLKESNFVKDEWTPFLSDMQTKHLIEMEGGKTLAFNVTVYREDEIRNLVDEIFVRLPALAADIQQHIDKEKNRQLTFGDPIRKTPVVGLTVINEYDFESDSKMLDTTQSRLEHISNTSSPFYIRITFPSTQKISYDIQLIFNIYDCTDIEYLKEKVSEIRSGDRVTSYKRKIYKGVCNSIDIQKVENTCKYIADKFQTQYISIVKTIEAKKVEQDELPFYENGKIVVYPYVVGETIESYNALHRFIKELLAPRPVQRFRKSEQYHGNCSVEDLNIQGRWKTFNVRCPDKPLQQFVVNTNYDNGEYSISIYLRSEKHFPTMKTGKWVLKSENFWGCQTVKVPTLEHAILETINCMLIDRY